MIGIVGFLALSMLAMAGALDGEIAMPATPELIRSSTMRTSPVSSALDAGPVYTHLYSEFGFSLFQSSHPLPSTVKKGLSRPFTTTARVFFWARAGLLSTSRNPARPVRMSMVRFIRLLRVMGGSELRSGLRVGRGVGRRRPPIDHTPARRPTPGAAGALTLAQISADLRFDDTELSRRQS